MYIDLRPPEVISRIQRRKLVRLCGRTWSVAAVLGIAVLGMQYRELRAKGDFAAARFERAGPLQADERRIEVLQTELAEDEARLAKLSEILPKDRSLDVIAVLADSVEAAGGQVVVDRLEFSDRIEARGPAAQTPARAAAQPTGISPSQSTTLSISAVAVDDAAIATFVQILESAKFFRELKLNATQTLTLQGGEAKDFDIECKW